MKVHILDDWFDTLRTLPCFRLLDGHDVTVWTDHEPDAERLAARVAEAEALVLFRERTRITEALIA
ncbi:MAG: D-2-hydroxyacid dehydrogenase family protein, partial [Pseudomonadota bacterium]